MSNSDKTAKGKGRGGRAKKDVGHGGLDEWFSGHGQGKSKSKGKATWGDWVSISPVKKKIKTPGGKEKTVSPGDIVGPCGISKKPEWKELTNNGKDPLKCMPRQKAHDMPKKERAEKAKGKMRKEKSSPNTGKPVNTETFEKKRKASITRLASRYRDEEKALKEYERLEKEHGRAKSRRDFSQMSRIRERLDELASEFGF